MGRTRLSAGEHSPETHEVTNQSPPLENYNLYRSDAALQSYIALHGAEPATAVLVEHGDILGRRESLHNGFLANASEPQFHSHDRHGIRLDVVEYHPAYHYFMELAISRGLHSEVICVLAIVKLTQKHAAVVVL